MLDLKSKDQRIKLFYKCGPSSSLRDCGSKNKINQSINLILTITVDRAPEKLGVILMRVVLDDVENDDPVLLGWRVPLQFDLALTQGVQGHIFRGTWDCQKYHHRCKLREREREREKPEYLSGIYLSTLYLWRLMVLYELALNFN